MKFGVFDHMDHPGRPLDQHFTDRLRLAEVYDRLGLYGYHVAEHHFTPLGMASSPGIFLSAVAQRTTTLRFGPLVYILPFYHPLRLAEEVCMLDQLSGGRLELADSAYFGQGIAGPNNIRRTEQLVITGPVIDGAPIKWAFRMLPRS